MLKFNTKLMISASIVTAAVIFATGCVGETGTGSSSTVTAPSIDGGVKYPVSNGKTGPYYVSEQHVGMSINNGRVPTANELKEWNKDVMPDGTGLPEGSGSVEEGEELYESKCVICHGDFGSGGGGYPTLSKGNAYELQKTLTNNRWKDPEADGPVRVFGSYWPQASTLWWYIHDAMPHTKSKTLTPNEVYSLVAYILSINEFEIDGEEVDEEYVLDREKFLKIKMPNRDGFEPNIDGPNARNNIRAYYSNPNNFGAQKVKPSERCMTNCQEDSAVVTRIKNGGIKDFEPPISVERDLPEVKLDNAHTVSFNAQEAYKTNCTMCHGVVSPAAKDKEAWAPYLAKGKDKMIANGIAGTEMGMPAKGGSSLTDAEFKQVVNYMVNFK